MPSSVTDIVIESGGYLEVVPGVKNVGIEDGGGFGRLSDGTVSIIDCRTDVEIRPEQLEGVTTVRNFSTCYRDWLRWVPPTVEYLGVVHIEERALAACPYIRKLVLGNNEGHVIPPSVRDLKIDFYTGAPIPPWIEKLTIDSLRAPIVGDLQNLTSIMMLKGFYDFAEWPVSIREVYLQAVDLDGYVFPEGITDLTLIACRGMPVFPKSLKRLYHNGTNPYGNLEGVESIKLP